MGGDHWSRLFEEPLQEPRVFELLVSCRVSSRIIDQAWRVRWKVWHVLVGRCALARALARWRTPFASAQATGRAAAVVSARKKVAWDDHTQRIGCGDVVGRLGREPRIRSQRDVRVAGCPIRRLRYRVEAAPCPPDTRLPSSPVGGCSIFIGLPPAVAWMAQTRLGKPDDSVHRVAATFAAIDQWWPLPAWFELLSHLRERAMSVVHP